jgi:4-hydroxybenzoyl-CoA thioesterase
MSTLFLASYPVRFGEIDHAGVMYYPAIFDRIHRAFEDFWPEALGQTYAQVLADDGIGFPLVDVRASFHRPFRFGDLVEVSIGVARIGTSSIDFAVELSGPGEDAARTTARLTTAVIDLNHFTSLPLPTRYREALRPFVIAEADPGAEE